MKFFKYPRLLIFHLLVYFQVVFILGCTEETKVSENSLLEPKVITELRRQNIGPVTLDISINNQTTVFSSPVGEIESRVLINSEFLQQDTNIIEFTFNLTPSSDLIQNTAQEIATASTVVAATPPGSTLEIPPILYQYTDSDTDGIADIHEWLVQNTDIDSDQIPNNIDSDSDNDGVEDGIDPTPYGDFRRYVDTADLPFITFQLPDSSQIDLPMSLESQLILSTEFFSETNSPIQLRIPTGWPFDLARVPSASTAELLTWGVIDVGQHVRMNCPDLRIALDTSSFEASANGAVFLYFRRSDSETVVAAVESGTVSSLRNISADVSDLANTVALTAELDEALRFIIVSPLATGWLTLWTEPFLEGQSCSINLTNLTNIFEN